MRNIPIIVVSIVASEYKDVLLEKADLIDKPISKEELFELLNKKIVKITSTGE